MDSKQTPTKDISKLQQQEAELQLSYNDKMNPIDSKLDFNNCSDAELRQWLVSAVPIVEQFVIVAKRFCSIESIAPEPSPCDACSKKGQCIDSCNQLNDLLPGLYEGKGRHENLTGFYPDTLQVKERIRREDIFEKYKLWEEDFTENQWAAIEMYYGECMTEKEIAQNIGKSRSTINGLLNRAKKTKEKRDEKLRQETREQMKKKDENDGI